MLIAGIFGKRNIEKIDIQMIFPQEIYKNKETFIKVKLYNEKKLMPAFLIKIILPEYNIEKLIPFFEKEKEIFINIIPEKRGINKISEIYISSVFPFNFFIRSRKIDKEFEFIAFPEPKKCNIYQLGGKKDKGEITNDRIGFEGDFISIKDYIEGTPMKYIDFKSTAKTDKLKVKELSSLENQPIFIDFDKLQLKDMEYKINCVAFIVIESIKNNIPVGIKINGKSYKPDISYKHKINILTELALYEEL
ncbi:hypothetical protein JCM14244_01310 [Venenivibrio stagnispumantis]|uniref:DUF58 domain-containing protein n=1 Tax=Venenivibrio stagnispumantis TaxID=407998 RepID=A0AA45WKI2_9AQUI|nr:DUF58 domain-containing protein [Venenivibrio stagnispumantis]MCW4573482.1 DUF58 domain-containing protein [Venenivibrio stagnispumantis]SMP06756.1 Protein of unknown function DUF58 [Venenivibrio stagnispumantis]